MEHSKRLKPEVLAPAGNLDILKIAITYGADAVYIGGEAYGLRAAAHNFTNEEIVAVSYTHLDVYKRQRLWNSLNSLLDIQHQW